MKIRNYILLLLALGSLLPCFAKIELPRILGSHMVLQQNAQQKIWGWGDPNETFTIHTEWDKAVYEVKVGVNAKFSVAVPTPIAGGPYTITFKSTAETIILTNILIGEVWLCSGQSNMEWSANSGIDNAEMEIEAADYPNIRLFSVAKRTAAYPQENGSGTWEACTPETMRDFSAVAYFYARRLQEELQVPIGLVDASWGASSAEVWTPNAVFEDQAHLKVAAAKIEPNEWVSTEPSSLYNAMIAPLTSLRIAGVIWYQGESNTANADSYQNLFTEMVKAWRHRWDREFPFYYVQIAPYAYGNPEEGVIVRDQQRKSLSLPRTAMVVTGDIATTTDIHPRNKQDVGLRLANIALKENYKVLTQTVHGPLFREIKVDDRTVTVHFDHAQGLTANGAKLQQFEVAGEDGIFVPAKAKISGTTVLVRSKEVKRPVYVRFAWSNTALATLFNNAGLPASSFTTKE